MRLYQLYLITNNINNKKYIGQVIQTRGYLKRFKEHINSANNNSKYLLHLAIKKYGSENFSVKLLLHNIPEDKINFYEVLWIEKFQTYYRYDKGYNMTLGGQGTHGTLKTNEGRKISSIKMKQYWEEVKKDTEKYNKFCQQRKDFMTGRHFSKSHKEHLSQVAKKRIGDKNPFYNKTHKQTTKDLISKANSKRIAMLDIDTGECLMIFNSIAEASNYIIEKGITKNKNCNSRISKICRGVDKSAYGYGWKFI